jgi:molybdate transport system regulatory protein
MATLKLSIIFESGARIGPGKAQLLQSIRDTGSISAAAREMGMSYKQAWLLLDSLNAAFNKPVVAAATGGHHGGGARLTPFGEDVLGRYRRMVARAADMFAADLDALQNVANPDAGPKV